MSEICLGVAFAGLQNPLASLNFLVAANVGRYELINLVGGPLLILSLVSSTLEVCYILSSSRWQPLSDRFNALLLIHACNVSVSIIYLVLWLKELRKSSVDTYASVGVSNMDFVEYKLAEAHTYALSDEEDHP